MDDARFDAELEEIARELRARRARCPDPERIAEVARGAATGVEAEAVREHLRLCAACRQLAEAALAPPAEIDDVTWEQARRRLDARPAPWRPRPPLRRPATWLAATAAVLAAVALSYNLLAPRSPATERISVTRGATLQILEPIGEVREIGTFRWQAPPLDLDYRVVVRRDDAEVWSGLSSDTALAPPAELVRELTPGATYRWRVEGLDEGGQAVVTSEWVGLRLRPPGD
ncbi:MAG TPA: zf-HC2 domain-containing protein [Planctomycetota bacterium]|nr:zf-HC2 domain-containing protein [Planctomycetota bacterium]